MTAAFHPGADAVAAKGWLRAHKWLLARRGVQLGLLALFAAGPWLGLWIVKGTLASSLTLDVLPLSDPLVLLQSLAAGHSPAGTVVLGAAILAAAYMVVGGRVYCSWVCPVNIVSDAAHWLNRRLKLPKGWQPRRQTRLWMLAMILAVSALSGVVAWELVNPITLLHRAVMFGGLLAWLVVAAVFLLEAFVGRRSWCGALCPVGAFYGLIGAVSLLRVSAAGRAACNDCMDCFAVCPEPQVISPALRRETARTPAGAPAGPVILSRDCTNCGRCIDVCALDVFRFTHRFDSSQAAGQPPIEAELHRAA